MTNQTKKQTKTGVALTVCVVDTDQHGLSESLQQTYYMVTCDNFEARELSKVSYMIVSDDEIIPYNTGDTLLEISKSAAYAFENSWHYKINTENEKYSKKNILMYVGHEAIKGFKDRGEIVNWGTQQQHVAVSDYSLEKITGLFGLNVNDLTEDTLRETMGVDLLFVPKGGITKQVQEKLPKNILIYENAIGIGHANTKLANEIAAKTNAYYIPDLRQQ